MAQRISLWIDRSAVGLSGLCLLHCLVGTLFFAALAAGGSGIFGHGVHQFGLAVAIPLAAFGLTRGLLIHGRWSVVGIGGIGIAFMAAALWTAHGAEEFYMTMAGVLLVGVAHLMNIRLLQR